MGATFEKICWAVVYDDGSCAVFDTKEEAHEMRDFSVAGYRPNVIRVRVSEISERAEVEAA